MRGNSSGGEARLRYSRPQNTGRLLTDRYDSRHPSGYAIVPSMREELITVPIRAPIAHIDPVGRDARIDQLHPHRFAQIDVSFPRPILPHRRSAAKNPPELRHDLRPDFKRLES